MKYDTKRPEELSKAFDYLSELGATHSLVEVKRVSKIRSLRQNAYLHVTFDIFGSQTGYDAQESKVIYKRIANPRIYVYEKHGEKFLRSSRDLNTKEMTDSIEKWRKYAAEHGVDIPAPDNQEALMHWQNVIGQEGKFL